MQSFRAKLAVLSFVVIAATSAVAVRQHLAVGPDMTRAAQALLASLDNDQRQLASRSFDDPSRLDWHFIPKAERKGIPLADLNDAQRAAALALLRAALSETGYKKTLQTMAVESLLRVLEKDRKNGPVRDPDRYYLTLFGSPAPQARWGLSFEGHHLSLNFVVDRNAVLSHTPAFFGANPTTIVKTVDDAPAAGTRILNDEEILAFQLVNLLDKTHQARAIIADKAPREIRAAGQPHAPDDAPAGLAARNMNAHQRAILRQLIDTYLASANPASAAQRRAEIDRAFDDIHFAWAGALKPAVGHYYRVQGPTFLIELVNNQADSLGTPANHVHAVFRDMRGDFGLTR